jgi:hypothetical protein
MDIARHEKRITQLEELHRDLQSEIGTLSDTDREAQWRLASARDLTQSAIFHLKQLIAWNTSLQSISLTALDDEEAGNED